MAKFVIEWRQFGGEGAQPAFVHRVAYASNSYEVAEHAARLGDAAWHREFRIQRAGHDVFTNLHRIQDWADSSSALPDPSPNHIWYCDLKRDLSADRFLDIVTRATVPAIAASVLARHDADTILRFARKSLRRPRL